MTKKPETVKEEDLIVGEDGLYYKKNTKVAFTGISEEFFEKGQLKDRKNRKKEKLDGLWKTFFAGKSNPFILQGELKEKGNHKEGKQIDLFGIDEKEKEKILSYKSSKDQEISQLNEKRERGSQLRTRKNYKNGKKHGLQEDFHKNGKSKFKGNYKNGKKDGLTEMFHAKGHIKQRENYKNGKKHGLFEEFSSYGGVGVKVNYKNGKKHGLYQDRYDQGNYKEGKKDGFWKISDDNSRGDYKNGEKHGLWESYYNGKLSERVNYKNGIKHGLWEKFYDNGQLKTKVNYNNGKLIDGLWDVYDYIAINVKDILIPDLEVISHIKPTETEHGFINFLWKYPVFPKRNKEEIQFSKEALYWYKDFHDLWLDEGYVVGDYTSPLGGIRFKDQKKRRYRQSLGSVHALVESDYFENVYSFYEESIYRYDGWFDDRDCDFTDEGIDFKWSYPPYFTIFDEGIKQFPQRLWEYFLERRVEMTLNKEEFNP